MTILFIEAIFIKNSIPIKDILEGTIDLGQIDNQMEGRIDSGVCRVAPQLITPD
jgi:hypothetical protein